MLEICFLLKTGRNKDRQRPFGPYLLQVAKITLSIGRGKRKKERKKESRDARKTLSPRFAYIIVRY